MPELELLEPDDIDTAVGEPIGRGRAERTEPDHADRPIEPSAVEPVTDIVVSFGQP